MEVLGTLPLPDRIGVKCPFQLGMPLLFFGVQLPAENALLPCQKIHRIAKRAQPLHRKHQPARAVFQLQDAAAPRGTLADGIACRFLPQHQEYLIISSVIHTLPPLLVCFIGITVTGYAAAIKKEL